MAQTKMSIIAMSVIGIGGFLVADKALPVINSVLTGAIDMAGKAVTLGVMGAGIAFVGFVAINPQTRALISNLWGNAMQSVKKMVISSDPIKILRNYIEKGEKQLTQVGVHVANLTGKARQADQIINSNDDAIIQANKLAQAAHKQGNQQLAMLKMNEAQRLREFNERLTISANQTRAMLELCNRIKNALSFTLDDLRSKVDISEREYEALLEQHKAITGAKSWLSRNNEDKKLFDEAMQHLVDDYGMKMEQIEDAMTNMQPFLEQIDLQKGLTDTQALEKFEEWERSLFANHAMNIAQKQEPVAVPIESKSNSQSVDQTVSLFDDFMKKR